VPPILVDEDLKAVVELGNRRLDGGVELLEGAHIRHDAGG
jgi:hypothetical protein